MRYQMYRFLDDEDIKMISEEGISSRLCIFIAQKMSDLMGYVKDFIDYDRSMSINWYDYPRLATIQIFDSLRKKWYTMDEIVELLDKI